MGCGASTQSASEAVPRASGNGGIGPTSAHVAESIAVPEVHKQEAPPEDVVTVEPISTLSHGPIEEPDSPTMQRVTDKKRHETCRPLDQIPTVCTASFDSIDDEVRAMLPKMVVEETVNETHQPSPPAPAPVSYGAPDDAVEDDFGSIRLKGRPVLQLGGPCSTSDVLDVERLAPPTHTSSLPPLPAVTLRPLACHASGDPQPALASRYDDISLSDDDDDAQGFDLNSWRRFYKWNKTKHADLLEFLWRRFDSRTHSIYCITYKDQDKMFATYMGDNVVHGLCCRLESSGLDVFCNLHTLVNRSTNAYKVLGVLILSGSEIPAKFAALPDYDQFQVLKADTKDPLVRQFVGNLITGASPVPDFVVVCSQDVSGKPAR